MKKILTVSLIAMMAVSAARADIASTDFVTDKTGDVSTLATSSKVLTGAVNELVTSVSGVKATADAAAKASDLTALQGTVTTLSGTVSANKATADKTQEDLDALEATVEGIDAAYKAADTTLTNKFGDLGNQTVKAYVDAKTENIASSDTVSDLAGRVDTAEGDIDALQTSLAAGGATATAIADAKKAGTDAAAALDAYKESNGTALAGVKATAEAALPTADFNSFKTENTNAIATAKSEAIEAAATDAASKYQVKALANTTAEAEGKRETMYPTVKLVADMIDTSANQSGALIDAAQGAADAAQDAADAAQDTADANAALIEGMDLAEVKSDGMAIVSVSEANGKVSAKTGTITNAGIAANAGIEQSKIAGLADSLSAATAAALTQLADKATDGTDGVYTLTMKQVEGVKTLVWEKIAR